MSDAYFVQVWDNAGTEAKEEIHFDRFDDLLSALTKLLADLGADGVRYHLPASAPAEEVIRADEAVRRAKMISEPMFQPPQGR